MYVSKKKLDEIKREHNGVIVVDDDVAAAFAFVHAVLCAEADVILSILVDTFFSKIETIL